MKDAYILSLAAMLMVGGSARAQQTPASEPPATPKASQEPAQDTSKVRQFIYYGQVKEEKSGDPNAPLQPVAPQQVGMPSPANLNYRPVLTHDGKQEIRVVEAPNAPSNPKISWMQELQPYILQNSAHYGWSTLHVPMPSDGIGADLVQADFSLRAPLNLPNDRGLVVTNVVPNGPAAMVGLQNNDILLTLADKPLDKPEDFLATLEAAQKSTPAPHVASLALLRAGKPITLSVRATSKVALAPVPAEPTPDYFIGVRTSAVDETLRSHLTLPAGTGVVVLEVVPDSPAAKAGLAAGDILLAFETKPLTSPETLRDLIQAEGPKKATLSLFRKGTETRLAVTPERRKPEPTAAGADAKALQQQEQIVVELQKLVGANNLGTINLGTGNIALRGVNGDGKVMFVNADEATLSKKIDELNAQIQLLNKAVEELRKEKK